MHAPSPHAPQPPRRLLPPRFRPHGPSSTRPAGRPGLRAVLDACLPHRCAACGRTGGMLCAPCARTLPLAPARTPPAGLDSIVGLLDYRDTARRVVTDAKYGPGHDLLRQLGGALGALLDDLLATNPDADIERAPRPALVVTWAPTTRDRARQRGGDQAEVLARAAARASIHEPFILGTLERRGRGHQVGRDRSERIESVEFRPAAAPPVGARVVLVDDVCTTGATLTAAAETLRRAGASRVDGLVLAIRG